MSSILTNAKGKLLAALFAIAAAIALTVAIAPASAYADDIVIYDGSTGLQIASVDVATVNVDSTTAKRAQFYKDNVWNVVEGTDCITVDDFLTTYAPIKWANASYIKFATTDWPDGYVKYNGGVFTKSEMTGTRNFYFTTLYNSSTTAIPTSSSDYAYKPIFAFEWGSETQTSAANAGNTSVSTYDSVYPRLLWGLESTNPASVAGNRFPADIEAIYIY